MRRIVLTTVGALVLSACVGAARTTADWTAARLDEAGVEVGSTWQLESGQLDGQALRILDDRPITFERTPDGVEGQSSCNTYDEFGLELDDTIDDDLVFPGLANTELGCPLPGTDSLDNPIMDLEGQYLAALYATTDVDVVDRELVLRGPTSTLVFRPAANGGTPAAGAEHPEPGPTPGSSAPASTLPEESTWVLVDARSAGEPLARRN